MLFVDQLDLAGTVPCLSDKALGSSLPCRSGENRDAGVSESWPSWAVDVWC